MGWTAPAPGENSMGFDELVQVMGFRPTVQAVVFGTRTVEPSSFGVPILALIEKFKITRVCLAQLHLHLHLSYNSSKPKSFSFT